MKGAQCMAHSDIKPADTMLSKLRHLAVSRDPARSTGSAPPMSTAKELAEFVVTYNDLVQGYQELIMEYAKLNPDQQSIFHRALDQLNAAARSEHMIDGNGHHLFNHSFQLQAYSSTDPIVKHNALEVVKRRPSTLSSPE